MELRVFGGKTEGWRYGAHWKVQNIKEFVGGDIPRSNMSNFLNFIRELHVIFSTILELNEVLVFHQ